MAPLLALAASLIPLVADVAPPLVRFLVGDKVADTTKKVSDTAELVAKTIEKITGAKITGENVNTEQEIEKLRQKLREKPELKNQLYIELSRIDLELERIELERDKAFLADIQNARSTAIERLKVGGSDKRANVMLISAFVAVVAIVALLVIPLGQEIPAEVVGFVIGIGGMFARNIGSAFDFEFGSSKGSREKDDKLQLQLLELQQASRERVADKAQEIEKLSAFVDASRSPSAGSTAEKLRNAIGSS
ncbi:hypothetical protein L3Q72_12775 [Vibrio sp. JC009]|uniref:hypothetical protein n=1 Tax=Vibrio sp. JC009 TaxID=2912314 RepID=UPI0023AF866C|nr:hypothetical protein [Vibrio sp. JC009]WED21490.1 hypothetical protein L3Q72_12775 [Vibrio sp. JC009]